MAEVLREALDDHRTRLGTTGQGAGFNIEFFAHANWQTLASAIVALQPVLLVVLGYLLLVLPCLFLMPKASARHRSPARFVAWGLDIRPGVIDRPGTHFDVMPTLMDFLGLSAWTEHYLGASLLRFDSPWFDHDSPLSLRVVHELPTFASAGLRGRLQTHILANPCHPLGRVCGEPALSTRQNGHATIRFIHVGVVV